MKMIKSLEESGLLITGVSKTMKNGAKKQRGRFVSMLLGAASAGLIGNQLAGKGVKWSKIPGCKANIHEQGVMRASKGTIRAGI